MRTIVATEVKTGELHIGTGVLTVEFPISAVMEAEKTIGKPLKSLTHWLALTWADLPAVLQAGLRKHHASLPDGAAKDICEGLGPEGISNLHEALCRLAFPVGMAKLEELVQQRRSGKVPNEHEGREAKPFLVDAV